MSLLAEEVVEEWLNRKGYFTIRGIKLGVHEIDLLAIKPDRDGGFERRHIEVQVSIRPVSYICHLPKEVQKSQGRAANSAKRSEGEIAIGVGEWVAKKFEWPKKIALKQLLAPGPWTQELVLHKVKSEDEVKLIAARGVVVHRLSDVVAELRSSKAVVNSASGGALLELIHLSSSSHSTDASAAADIIAAQL